MAREGYFMTREEIEKQIDNLREEHKLLTYKTQGAIEILDKMKVKLGEVKKKK